jgi:hypothetical protein
LFRSQHQKWRGRKAFPLLCQPICHTSPSHPNSLALQFQAVRDAIPSQSQSTAETCPPGELK